jgi:hypothetical protein
MTLEERLITISYIDALRFGVWCSEQVAHLNTHPTLDACRSTIIEYINSPVSTMMPRIKETTNAILDIWSSHNPTDSGPYTEKHWAAFTLTCIGYSIIYGDHNPKDYGVLHNIILCAKNAIHALQYVHTISKNELTEEGLFAQWLDSHLLGV